MSAKRCPNCGSAPVSVCDTCLTDTVERLVQQRSSEAHTAAFHAVLARDQMKKERDEAREHAKALEDTLRLAQKWLGRVEWGEGANEMLRTINMVAAVLDKPHPWAKPGEP